MLGRISKKFFEEEGFEILESVWESKNMLKWVNKFVTVKYEAFEGAFNRILYRYILSIIYWIIEFLNDKSPDRILF